MRFRHATNADLPQIAQMAEQFWMQTDLARAIPFDYESTVSTAQQCMEQGLMIVADAGEGRLVGMVGGLKAWCIANYKHSVGSEIVWYVEPEERRSNVGGALLNAIERAAQEAGVTYWSMMLLESVEPEKAEAFYLAAGYRRSERTFVKRLN